MDKHVTRKEFLLRGRLPTIFHLYDFLGRDDNLIDLFLQASTFFGVVDIGTHLILVTGIGVNDIPSWSHITLTLVERAKP